MSRKALVAIAAVSSFLIADVAAAQDGGIWAARPHRRIPPPESVPASALPGLVLGLTVQSSAGKPIGRISQIVTGGDGSIRKVIVVSPSGNAFKLSPTTLSITGGIVTTRDEKFTS